MIERRNVARGTVCGDGYTVDGIATGCGEAFDRSLDVYRCTDCDVAFHKHCAREHFERSKTGTS